MKWLNDLMILNPLFTFAEGDGGGDAGDNKDDKGEGDDKDKGINKEDYDSLMTKFQEKEKEVDDLRYEILTPAYNKFLEQEKQNAGKDKDAKDKGGDKGDDAVKGLQTKIDDLEKQIKGGDSARINREIDAFAETHADFDQLKPVMQGLSYRDDLKGASLSKLHTAALEYVKKIHAGATEAEQKKAKGSEGEKPGGSPSAFKKDGSKYSDAEASEDAWNETVGKNGFPSA